MPRDRTRSLSRGRAITSLQAFGIGLGVSALLVVFFSPSWASFVAWQREPAAFRELIPVRRGTGVIAQVENPMVELDDPMHDSIRWRLLFPVVGHLLRLPPALVLAFAPAGCVLLLALLVAGARARGVPWNECALLAIVVGGESWFFTS